MLILFFDIESTGLPRDWKAPVSDLDNWPRVIELAASLHDSDTEGEVAALSVLIDPDGWTVPDEPFWRDRGMTTAKCMLDGVSILEAATAFLSLVERADYLVAHNLDFDQKVMAAECLRLGLSSTHRPVKLCTKELSTQYCKIRFNTKQRRFPGQQYKWPSLEELWGVLFGKDTLVQEHRAKGDVEVLKTCFFELVRRHVIRLPKKEVAP